MAYYTDGISNVRFTARPGNTKEIFVEWDSTYTDKLYQIYVNGTLADATKSVDEPNCKIVIVESIFANFET